MGIILNIPSLIIVTRFVFQKDSKCYPQALQKCYKRVTKMLQYGKIDASAGIDVDKTDASKECMLCHYWCFVYNRCHVLMTAYELKKHFNIECKRC